MGLKLRMSKMSWSSATCVASVGSEVGSLESSHVPRQASLTSSTSTWWLLNILKLRCVVPASEDSLQGMSFIRVVDERTALFICPQQQVRPHSQSHGTLVPVRTLAQAMCPRRRLWPTVTILQAPFCCGLTAHEWELPMSIWVLGGMGLVLTAHLKQGTQNFSAKFSDVIAYAASWLRSRRCATTVCFRLDVSVSLYGPGRMLYRT